MTPTLYKVARRGFEERQQSGGFGNSKGNLILTSFSILLRIKLNSFYLMMNLT